ncbi:Hypothetical predicted protein [Paramuricea clavata]|uniref:Uncharacterized protein n=1 Tax=Paramuricea clavata TaxID=317549 RepID=A0A6S7H1M3_PARCT|nr:Hypothetical predicted protein [Paramuricea clavata]
MSCVKSLFDLATNVFVRHVNLLCVHTEAIPPVLYECLLKASMETDRILSIRHIFLSWPLQKLSLVDCREFKEQYALVLAHSLQSGCNKLREIDLTGCNIGVRGTTLLLMLAAGQSLPNITEYCSNKDTTNKHTAVDKNKDRSDRLSITTNCYVDENNYELFLDVLEGDDVIYDFTVSYFYAIALGLIRIEKILKALAIVQAESVIGLDLRMNDLPVLLENRPRCYKSLGRFSSLKYLNLSMNLIAFTIFFVLKHISAPLTHLILNNCSINAGHVYVDFARVATLPCIQKLEHLEIANNQFKEIGEGLMKLLKKCSGTLSFLSLEGNCLTDTDVPIILQLLEAPFVLETLHIGKNNFSINSERLLYSKDKLHKIEDIEVTEK